MILIKQREKLSRTNTIAIVFENQIYRFGDHSRTKFYESRKNCIGYSVSNLKFGQVIQFQYFVKILRKKLN